MRITLQSVCESIQRSPAGLTSLILSSGCGLTYLASVVIPGLLQRRDVSQFFERDTLFQIMIIGSGVAFLLALLSVGLERPLWPGIASLCILTITELPVVFVMPFWTLMLLGAWSGWAVLSYIAAFIAALVLIVRRAATGRVIIDTHPQFGRCPLVIALKGSLGSR